MLIDDLLNTLTARAYISEEEIAADPFLAMLQVEVSLRRYRRLVLKRRWGQAAPGREEEQNCLLPGANVSRSLKGGTPF